MGDLGFHFGVRFYFDQQVFLRNKMIYGGGNDIHEASKKLKIPLNALKQSICTILMVVDVFQY